MKESAEEAMADRAKAENMWQFGTRPSTSDVLLGHRGTKGISAKQCNLTIDDDEHCIWLHDYHSTHGTAVGYNGQKDNELRRNHTNKLFLSLVENFSFSD